MDETATDRIALLSLRCLPARLRPKEAAWLLKPLGKAPRFSIRYFHDEQRALSCELIAKRAACHLDHLLLKESIGVHRITGMVVGSNNAEPPAQWAPEDL